MKKIITACLLTISSFSLLLHAAENDDYQPDPIEQIIYKYNYAAQTTHTVLSFLSSTPLHNIKHFKRCYQEKTITPVFSTLWSAYSFTSFCKDIKNLCFLHTQDMTRPLTFSSIAWTSILATYFIAAWYCKTPISKILKKKFNITELNMHAQLPIIVFKHLEQWIKPALIRSCAYHGIRSIGYIHTKLA